MSYPKVYERGFDFQGASNSNPLKPIPGEPFDGQFEDVSAASSEVVDFLKQFVTEDGRLRPGTVGVDQLDKSVNLGFGPPAPWEPGTAYGARDTVFYNNDFYVCETAHTSGDAFDIRYWSKVTDFQQIAADAEAARDETLVLAGEVDEKVNNALGQVGEAVIAPDGVSQARVLKSYLGDRLSVDYFVADALSPSAAWANLQDALNAAVARNQVLFASRDIPAVNIGANKLLIPSGLRMVADGLMRIKHTATVVTTTTGAENIDITGLVFEGAHDLSSTNINDYTFQFKECTDVHLDVRFVNGNSGVLFEDCHYMSAAVHARNMVANGSGVKGWDCKGIELSIDVLNAKGFGLYGSDGGCNVHVQSLRKRYDESAMTQYLLDSRRYELLDYFGAGDPRNTYRYTLGLEGLGLTAFTENWAVDYVHIERTSDNGISMTGNHHAIGGGIVLECAHDGVHSYGMENSVRGVTARRCGYRSSNGFAVTGYGFNASGSSGGVPHAVTFSQCRGENNIKGQFNYDGGTYTNIWTSGGTPTRSYVYWEDANWGYVFYSGGAVPGAFGTTSPAAAGWAYNESLNASLQPTWNDGVTTWRYRSRKPAMGGPWATMCRTDVTCIAYDSVEANKFTDGAPASAKNVFGTGSASGTGLANGLVTADLASNGVMTLFAAGANAGTRPVIEMYRANGSGSSPTDVTLSAILAEFRASGLLGGVKETEGYMRAIVGALSGGVARTSWQFFGKDAAGAALELFRINYDGAPWSKVYAHNTEQSITTVTGNAITVAEGLVSLDLTAPASISTINCALVGAFILNIRNNTTNIATFTNNANLRLNGGANIALSQNQSLTLRRVGNSGAVWQQI